jgi:ribosomal protein S18 acetylase RimI-like enzyme
VAYAGNDLIGCATVRHPDAEGNVTVIARVIPEYRRRGYGETLYLDAMEVARNSGGEAIEKRTATHYRTTRIRTSRCDSVSARRSRGLAYP